MSLPGLRRSRVYYSTFLFQPLNDFCKVIRREIQVMVGRAVPTPESWIMSSENHPIAPASFLSAEDLSKKSVEEIRRILARGAELQSNLPSPNKFKDNQDGGLRVVTTVQNKRRDSKDWESKASHNQEELVSMIKKDATD